MVYNLQAHPAACVDVGIETGAASIGCDGCDLRRFPGIVWGGVVSGWSERGWKWCRALSQTVFIPLLNLKAN